MSAPLLLRALPVVINVAVGGTGHVPKRSRLFPGGAYGIGPAIAWGIAQGTALGYLEARRRVNALAGELEARGVVRVVRE